jgi:hypothetical protein
MEFLRFVVSVVVIFGPMLVWLILLNLRDRRISRLRLAVAEPLAAADLRGRVAVRVRCAMFSRRNMVIVDALACTHHEVWDIFTRVTSRLPPYVRLLVHAALGQQFAGQLTLETVTRRLPADHARAFLVTG